MLLRRNRKLRVSRATRVIFSQSRWRTKLSQAPRPEPHLIKLIARPSMGDDL